MDHAVIDQDLATIIGNDLPWGTFSGRTVLITGASGLIPSYMVDTLMYLNQQQLLDEPVHILALVRNEKYARERFSAYQDDAHLELLVQDVCEPVEGIGNVDFIIHAASQASPKYYRVDPVGTLSANIMGTVNMLELAKEKNLQSFLFISSGEVYGEVSEACIPTKESDYGYLNSMSVRSCYAESKRMAETMCVCWHQQYGVPVKVARPYHTYGPGMKLDDGRVFADFVSNIVRRKDIVMTSEGKHVRSFCYLTDATTGFFTVLLKGRNAEAYNIGNPDAAVSIAELAETLVSLFPEHGLKVVRAERSAHYVQSTIEKNVPSIAKAMELGWRPSIGIAEGFQRTISSYTNTL
ncbi:NAD-dependent epimerase/dehydratase family protein [Paenibacillus sp. P96]|uniref:NAD-dependent epimerase/dehydratase family protein n=1 Tax=Paenibacillus zeirhizosphaerae TaxID=2987519 RepID=A0ABT9FX80_9BACL|nr:NAD-dependent epimerase/dehydratase family protein [Paenibacillus sp. P96]MDP4099344.1 NAD-dependent epimerase/dehydratase family protein [Paenibacillus sp. P96]